MLTDIQNIVREVDFETPVILKAVVTATRRLAELKGECGAIPNPNILVSTLGLQESQDSAAIENIITTRDNLYKFPLQTGKQDIAAKEVHNYATALRDGYARVKKSAVISINDIVEIQQIVIGNAAGIRKQVGTALVNQGTGATVYVPPDPQHLLGLMGALEQFINDDPPCPLDPLIKMALIHHQFESIHPFYDGNGRVGRLLNIMYLVMNDLLDLPVLYLSRYINHTKGEYYRLLQEVRDHDRWDAWVRYMLEGVSQTARDTLRLVREIKILLNLQKQQIRAAYPKIYSQDLLNNIFKHPYTKIQFLQQDLEVSRPTATRYLESLARGGILTKGRYGRENYYFNAALVELLFNLPQMSGAGDAGSG